MRRPGAAAVDICFLAEGIFDGLMEFELHPWDISGALIVLLEAGGTYSLTNGLKSSTDIVASNGLIHDWMLSVVEKTWGLAMKYLVSVDFSDITNLVVRSAKIFATKLNAQLELLHVIAPFTYLPYSEGLSIDIVDMDIIQKAEENAKNLALEKLSALAEYLDWGKSLSHELRD